MRRPFYRKSHKCWYFKDSRGRFVRLDPDETVAHLAWTSIISRPSRSNRNHTLMVLFGAYLREYKPQTTDSNYDFAESVTAMFLARFGPETLWSDITTGMVVGWLRERKLSRPKNDGTQTEIVWSTAYQRDIGGIVKRVFRWAAEEGYIDRNPIASIRFKKSRPRSVIADNDTHKALVRFCRTTRDGKPFALYLIASRCGARPIAVRTVTAANVITLGEHCFWKFDEHKTAESTGKPLIVYLSPCLQTLTKILMGARPTGPLFRNSEGNAWDTNAVGARMRRLRAKLNLPPNMVCYAYRHNFATSALKAGVPIATVAALLGHTNVRMVAEVYGHLDQERQYLIDTVNKLGQ